MPQQQQSAAYLLQQQQHHKNYYNSASSPIGAHLGHYASAAAVVASTPIPVGGANPGPLGPGGMGGATTTAAAAAVVAAAAAATLHASKPRFKL